MNREDFPILSREVYGKPLVYLDNAATTQKPRCVVEAITEEYYNVNANVHRGVHFLSQKATDLHEEARERVRKFLNAESIKEIVFTRGTTESVNLLASSFAKYLRENGSEKTEVVVSVMEHHSNIVPWQLNGFKVKAFETMEEFETLLSEKTALVSVTQVSNVLGKENRVGEIVKKAHEKGVPVMVDAAQSVPHMKVDVKDLNCDFLAFSGHKVYGPTGIGVLYGKEEWLEKLPPYQGGGEMIDHVSFEKTTYNVLPYKFEAGTPDYIASHALAVALDYVDSIGIDTIHDYETELTRYAINRMKEIDGMRIYNEESSSVISFNLYKVNGQQSTVNGQQSTVNGQRSTVNGQEPSAKRQGLCCEATVNGTLIHHLDVGTLLDRLGVAVRTGHHCAEPLMRLLGVEGTVRASIAFYNTREDIDSLVNGLIRIQGMF